MGQGKNNRKKRDNQAEDGNGQVRQRDDEVKKLEKEIEEKEDNKLEEYGQVTLEGNRRQRRIYLITIIGEVEGHESSFGNSKTTKYDHILPKLTEIEDDDSVDGLLALLNTSGGDMDAGLAIAEMIASLNPPAVSLMLDESHSIGVPLAVPTNHSFIILFGTIMIRPVRIVRMVIDIPQVYEHFEVIQDRIFAFVSNHADIVYDQLRELIHNTKMLTRDLGTVLVGTQTVEAGLISQVGGIKEASGRLYVMIDDQKRR